MALQLLTDYGQAHQAHVKNQGFGFRAELTPVVIEGAVFEVTGHEADAAGVIAVGERDASIAGGGAGGGNTRNYLEGNGVFRQQFYLLAAAAEDKRIPPLEPHHPLALLSQRYQQLVDLILRYRMF